MSLLTVLFLLLIACVAVHFSQRRGGPSSGLGLALLSAFLALPVGAQDPQSVPPQAPPAVEPAPEPTPKPKAWKASVHAGESNLSTPESLSPYLTAGVAIEGEPWKGWTVGALGDLDRLPNGNALSIEGFARDFAGIQAGAYVRKRIGHSPVSVGAVGAVTWSRDSDIKSPSDPRLWTAEGIACIERFKYWPNGGTACVGAGLRGPVGGGAVSAYVTQPLKGGVELVAEFDLPFKRLPDFIRALPAAATAIPLQEGPPSPEQILGVGQRLPIRLKVGVRVPLKAITF